MSRNSFSPLRAATIAHLFAVTLLYTSVAAQSATSAGRATVIHDARWQPWLGCWKPTGGITPVMQPGVESISVAATMVCVVPGGTPTSVEVLNYAGGAVTERTVIEPGQATAKTVEDCSGTETATWSADGRRVMLRGTFTCGRNVARVESGVMSINVDGEWVQAQSVKTGAKVSTFVAHFHDTGIALEGVLNGALVERPVLDAAGNRLSPPRNGCTGNEAVTPSADSTRVSVKSEFTCGGVRRIADAEFVRSGNGQWSRVNPPAALFGTASSREEAGAPVTANDVLEVAKTVDVSVAEAWFGDRGQGFELNGKELVRLSDAGMPSRMIDMMVAVSNPRSFAVRKNDGTIDAEGRPMQQRGGADYDNDRCRMSRYSCYGMTGLGWMYGADRYYGYSPYDYLYSRNGPFYGGYYGPGYYSGYGPVVIVSRPSNPEPRGRAVYGQGYTRDTGPSSGGSSTQSSGSGSGGRTSSGSSGSSGASSSSGSSAGGGEARTAKPRPPS